MGASNNSQWDLINAPHDSGEEAPSEETFTDLPRLEEPCEVVERAWQYAAFKKRTRRLWIAFWVIVLGLGMIAYGTYEGLHHEHPEKTSR